MKSKVVNYQVSDVPENKLIEIHAEAYYRALKRIEEEKNKISNRDTATEKSKDTRFDYLLIILNLVILPGKLWKCYQLTPGFYDGILVLIVSQTLKIVGYLLWGFGWFASGYTIFLMFQNGVALEFFIMIGAGIMFAMLGSMLILAGKSFDKETDSNKIHAYSASIIALVSCVVAIIAILKGTV